MSDSNLASKSVKELRALIEQAGMTHHDCVEKNDLRARARDALVKLDGAAGGASSAAGTPPEEALVRDEWRRAQQQQAQQHKLDWPAIQAACVMQRACVVVYSQVSPTEILAWVLRSSDGGVAFHAAIAVDEHQQLAPLVARVRSTDKAARTEALRRAHALLVAPLAAALAGEAHLLVVPDGDLHALPFAALLDAGGKHLIERHSIRVAPSIGALVGLEARRAAARGGGAARPGAPALVVAPEDEADVVGREMEDNVDGSIAVMPPADVTKEALVRAMRDSAYVHLAGGGGAEGSDGAGLALATGDGGGGGGTLLPVAEVRALGLRRTKLVVLSRAPGAALVRAFAAAGAPTVVAPLWPAGDAAATRELLKRFYRQLLEDEDEDVEGNVAVAMQKAMRSLLKPSRKRTFSVVEWAPFVVHGLAGGGGGDAAADPAAPAGRAGGGMLRGGSADQTLGTDKPAIAAGGGDATAAGGGGANADADADADAHAAATPPSPPPIEGDTGDDGGGDGDGGEDGELQAAIALSLSDNDGDTDGDDDGDGGGGGGDCGGGGGEEEEGPIPVHLSAAYKKEPVVPKEMFVINVAMYSGDIENEYLQSVKAAGGERVNTERGIRCLRNAEVTLRLSFLGDSPRLALHDAHDREIKRLFDGKRVDASFAVQCKAGADAGACVCAVEVLFRGAVLGKLSFSVDVRAAAPLAAQEVAGPPFGSLSLKTQAMAIRRAVLDPAQVKHMRQHCRMEHARRVVVHMETLNLATGITYHGTGVVISADGKVLTAAHNFIKFRELGESASGDDEWKMSEGDIIKVGVFDPDVDAPATRFFARRTDIVSTNASARHGALPYPIDLVCFQIAGTYDNGRYNWYSDTHARPRFEHATVGRGDVAVGATVTACGFTASQLTGAQRLMANEGVVNDVMKNEGFILTSMGDTQRPGMSGGPLLNAHGEVVGIMSFDKVGRQLDQKDGQGRVVSSGERGQVYFRRLRSCLVAAHGAACACGRCAAAARTPKSARKKAGGGRASPGLFQARAQPAAAAVASPPASPGRPDEGRKVQRKWKRAAKKFVKLLSEDGGKYGQLLTRAQQAAIATNDAHMGKAFALYQMISYDEDGNNDGEKKYQVEEEYDNAAAAADFVADLKTAIPEVFA